MGPRGRRTACLAVVAIVLLMAHARAVLGGRIWFLKDALEFFYPCKLLVRRRLLVGDIPHWSAQAGLGTPLLADPSFSVLYPMNVALLLPEPSGVTVFLWLHLLIGALGTAALARRAATSWTAAGLGGLCFALAGYPTSMLASGTYLLGMVWTPAVIAAVDRFVDRPGATRCAILAALWGCQIASGEMQSVFVTGWLAGAWVLVRKAGGGRPSRASALAWLALAVVAAAGLAGAQLLPYLTLFAHSKRQAGLALEEAQRFSMHPIHLIDVLLPNVFGDANRSGSFFAFALDRDGYPFDRWPWMETPYVGGVTVLLAAAAWGAEATSRRFVRFWTAVAAVGTLLAFGRHTPIFSLWFRGAPLASAFRYPAKYFAPVSLAIPCLAAVGLDALLAHGARARRFLLVAAIVLTVAAVGVAVAAKAIASRTLALPSQVVDLAADVMREATVEGLVAPLIAALFVIVAKRHVRTSAAAIGLLGIADLWFHVVAPVPVLEGSVCRTRPNWVTGDHPRIWTEAGDVNLTGVTSPLPRAQAARSEIVAAVPNTPLLFGAVPAKLYTASLLRDDIAFWGAVKDNKRAFLDAYGVELLVRSTRETGGDGLEPVEHIPAAGVDVLRNTRALPRVYFAGDGIPVATPQEAVAMLGDPRVARGDAVLVPPGAESGGQPGDRDACREVRTDDGDTLRASCRSDQAGWAVFSYALLWGWTAEVDGAAAPIERANGRGMAIRVPAGRHDIVLRYREPAFALGLAMTLLTALGLATGIAIERRATT